MQQDLTNQPQPDAQATAPAPQALLDDSTPVAPPRPWLTATRILIFTNLLVFVITINKMGGDAFRNSRIGEPFPQETILAMGSDYGPLTLGGEYWRVITSMFLHRNFGHLFFNMLFLWLFGRALDRLFEMRQALLIYLLTGIASSLASLNWHPTFNSYGFSGVVYGQAGVLVALLALVKLNWSWRDKIKVLICMVLVFPFDVISGHLAKDVDYAGHAGGFASGLLIGALLAWTFRMPEPQRKGRQWRFLAFALEGLIVMFATIVQLRSDVVKQYREDQALKLAQSSDAVHNLKVRRVFIHVKGNPKLVHRLEGFLKVELEEAGIQIAGNEKEADAVIGGEITSDITHESLGLGIVKMQVTAYGNVEQTDFCAETATGEGVDYFDSSSSEVAEKIRQKYPNARTVKLDSASDTKASKKFDQELPGELKRSNFIISESLPADVILRINLESRKFRFDQAVVHYNISILTSKGAIVSTHSGNGSLYAKIVDKPPAFCAGRFSGLTWLPHNNDAFSLVDQIVEGLQDEKSDLADAPD
jgi:membrane associated rhomboid family serine protease